MVCRADWTAKTEGIIKLYRCYLIEEKYQEHLIPPCEIPFLHTLDSRNENIINKVICPHLFHLITH